jgi:hypothetical protein
MEVVEFRSVMEFLPNQLHWCLTHSLLLLLILVSGKQRPFTNVQNMNESEGAQKANCESVVLLFSINFRG